MFSPQIDFYFEAEDEVRDALDQAYGIGASDNYSIDGIIDEVWSFDEDLDAMVPVLSVDEFWAVVLNYKKNKVA